MSTVVIIGGGLAGMLAACELAECGHQIWMVERDGPPPADAFDAWQRPGIPQFRQSHVYLSAAWLAIERRQPRLAERLLEAGAREIRHVDHLPRACADQPAHPDEDDLRMLCARRPLVDALAREEMDGDPRIVVVPGVVERLLSAQGPEGVRRVTGVALADGELLPADLVVDASGSQGRTATWVASAGGRLSSEAEPCGLMYYTRHYRLGPDASPPSLPNGFSLACRGDAYVGLVLRGDSDTFSLMVCVGDDDRELRAAADEAVFESVVRAIAPMAAWRGGAVPCSGVSAMGGIEDRIRWLRDDDGQPTLTGYYPVGDSLCTTNPTVGGGISLAAKGIEVLVETLEGVEGEAERAAWYELESARRIEPFYRETLAADRARKAAWAAVRAGSEPAASQGMRLADVMRASVTDRALLRRVVRVVNLLDDPSEVLDDSEVARRVAALGATRAAEPGPALPSRQDLIAAVQRAGVVVGSQRGSGESVAVPAADQGLA